MVTLGQLELARFLKASAALDQEMRERVRVPPAPAGGLLWQRIAYADMGAERSFPAVVWKEAALEPYERYDPRLQSWFVAAASAPRALVVVLDTGAAMEEFDRRTIATRVVSGVLRSLGPADIVAFVAARDAAPRVFGCRAVPSECALPQHNASGLRLCVPNNATVEWMMAGATASFQDSTFGICDLGQGVALALKLIAAETEAWSREATAPAAPATEVLLPLPQVLVVASARGWAPPDSVRESAESMKVAIHAVSVGAVESDYERAWLRQLACGHGPAGALGALSHIPYRYIWQQTVGGWYRLASRKFVKDERIVAVSALHLSGHSGVPVVTLSAPIHGKGSEASEVRTVAGVVAMDVSPGLIFPPLARNITAHIQAAIKGAHSVSWSDSLQQEQASAEAWVVDASSGTVLAHPALPYHASGFTHLRDLEGSRVYSTLSRKWELGPDECAGPVVFTSRTWREHGGPWRLGRLEQRAAYMVRLGGVVEHLDAILIIVFGGGNTLFALRQTSDACQSAAGHEQEPRGLGLELTSRQPGFPLVGRNASGLVHHFALKVRPVRVATIPGAQVGEALYGSLGNITLSCSVYSVSRSGLKAPGGASGLVAWDGGGLANKMSASLDDLRSWLLVVNLTSSGLMYPAPPSNLQGGGPTERAVRDVLATSTLDAVWKQAWAVRQQLQDSGVITQLLALWRFVSVATSSGILRTFPGHILPENTDRSTSASYVKSLEGGSAGAVASLAGPYAHPLDGTPTVSIATVVWEAGALGSTPMGVVAVEFPYAGFILGALDTLDACAFLLNRRWCMLLDQHAAVVGVSGSKLTHTKVEAGVFVGEIEPLLLGRLVDAGLLALVEVTMRPGSSSGGGKGRALKSLELLLNATGVALENITSWDGVLCQAAVTFALEPVPGTNVILVVATGEADSVATPCGSPQVAPVSRAMALERLQAAQASGSPVAAASSQCRKPRSRPCSSCYLSVPAGSKPLAAGHGVVGSDPAQWVRETQANGANGGGDECVMQAGTLVRAHDGGAGDTSRCVWWRRRAGWC